MAASGPFAQAISTAGFGQVGINRDDFDDYSQELAESVQGCDLPRD